jgi:N-acetylmuramoyl-L-alanine amidase
MTTFLLNSGHGIDTNGKRSPFRPPGILEYEFNIYVVSRLLTIASEHGIRALHIDPEMTAVRLSELMERVNEYYSQDEDCMFMAIHANAAGNGKRWYPKASGSGVFISRTASQRSRDFAEILAPKIAEKGYFKNRGVKERGFYVLKRTKCPAILSENGFMTHPSDATKLSNDHWRDKIVEAHLEAMIEWDNLNDV